MRWINLAVFTIILSIVNVILLCKLRNRFDDFYADYGCSLKTIFIIQVLSILCLTVTSILDYYTDLWDTNIQQDKLSIHLLTVFGNITNWVMPMVTQLSCLIFGYIRHKNPNKPTAARPFYFTYFDPTVEFYTVSVYDKEDVKEHILKFQILNQSTSSYSSS